MQEITFSLRTITPLFLAGADQSSAELRAPSFRGEMRYWNRALVGGIFGTDPAGLGKTIDLEKSIFGATDSGSAIQVRISHAPIKTKYLSKDGNSQASASGRDYLLWSTFNRRPCIPERTPFQVIITARHRDKAQEELLFKQGISAFWLLTHFGGIGTRSRRGAGSLSVVSTNGEAGKLLFTIPASVDEVRTQLINGITISRELYSSGGIIGHNEPSFDILNNDCCEVWLLLNEGDADKENTWKTTDQALKDIGYKLRSYREALGIHKRKYFGIPVMVLENGKSKPLRIYGAGSIDASGKQVRRLASPLHLRISEVKVGQEIRYIGLATLFKTRWADMTDVDYKEYALLENWIKQEFSRVLRVTL